MTFEEVVQKVEAAGFFWAVGRDRADGYSAAVNRRGDYIGDDLSGPSVQSGSSPVEALLAALENERDAKANG